MAINEDLSNYINTLGVTQEEVKTLLFGEESGEVELDDNGKIRLTEEQVKNLEGEQLVWLRNLYQDRFDQAFPRIGEWGDQTEYLWGKIYSVDNWDQKKAPTPEIVEKADQSDVQQRLEALKSFITVARISDTVLGKILSEGQDKTIFFSLTEKDVRNLTGKQLLALQSLAPGEFNKQFENDQMVNDLINSELGYLKLRTSIINGAINKTGKKLDHGEKIKLSDALDNALSQFDAGYLEANKTAIAANMTKSLSNEGSTSIFNNNIAFSDNAIQKVANAVIRTNAEPNESYIRSKINQSIVDHQLSDSAIAERLSGFLITTSNKQGIFGPRVILPRGEEGYDIMAPNHEVSVEKLAEARKLNPSKFDAMMFPENELMGIRETREKERAGNAKLTERGNLTKSRESLVTEILGQVVAKLERDKGVKLQQENAEKIFAGMHKGLSEIDSKSLNDNKEQIAEHLAGAIYRKGTDVFVDPRWFEKFVWEIKNNNFVPTPKEAEAKVKEDMQEINKIILENKLSNSEIGERAIQFIAEQQLGEVDLKNLGFSKEQVRSFNSNTTPDLEKSERVFLREQSSKNLDIELAYSGNPEKMGKITDKQLTNLMRLHPQKFKETLGKKPGMLVEQHRGVKKDNSSVLDRMTVGSVDGEVAKKLGQSMKLITPETHNPRHRIEKTQEVQAKKEAFKKRKAEEAKIR
jgi:hypothetical protein